MDESGDSSRSRSRERIENDVILPCEREDQSFNKTNGKLAWVLRLLDVSCLYVGNVPKIVL